MCSNLLVCPNGVSPNVCSVQMTLVLLGVVGLSEWGWTLLELLWRRAACAKLVLHLVNHQFLNLLSDADRMFSLRPADYKIHLHESSWHSSQVLQIRKNQSHLTSRRNPFCQIHIQPQQKWRGEVLRMRQTGSSIRGQMRDKTGLFSLHQHLILLTRMPAQTRDGGGMGLPELIWLLWDLLLFFRIPVANLAKEVGGECCIMTSASASASEVKWETKRDCSTSTSKWETEEERDHRCTFSTCFSRHLPAPIIKLIIQDELNFSWCKRNHKNQTYIKLLQACTALSFK